MKWKTIVGIVLIILSAAGMFLWETMGREKLMLVSVLASSTDIRQGNEVDAAQFKEIKVLPENLPKDTLLASDAEKLKGKRASRNIYAGQQLCARDFTEAGGALPDGMSIYVLPESWIYARSSSLRAGDEIELYCMPEKISLGIYKVAFVRDSAEREVIDQIPADAVLERNTPSAAIASVEILCNAQQYFKLFDAVQAAGPASLLLAMRAH
ncbi:MAG: hypothetical protein GX975_04555 [Clostridiales bacterium]|nr:hypothetical protein [Clostridiales bacterium]